LHTGNPVLAGAAGNTAGNLTKQGIALLRGNQKEFKGDEVIFEASKGAALGYVTKFIKVKAADKVQIKISKINVGKITLKQEVEMTQFLADKGLKEGLSASKYIVKKTAVNLADEFSDNVAGTVVTKVMTDMASDSTPKPSSATSTPSKKSSSAASTPSTNTNTAEPFNEEEFFQPESYCPDC